MAKESIQNTLLDNLWTKLRVTDVPPPLALGAVGVKLELEPMGAPLIFFFGAISNKYGRKTEDVSSGCGRSDLLGFAGTALKIDNLLFLVKF